MNKLWNWITWVFAFSLVPYLVLAFTQLEWNPLHWSGLARFLLAVSVVFWGVIFSMVVAWAEDLIKLAKYNKDEKD